MKAFPGTPTFDQDANRTIWQEGMNLRDYFAAHAMECMINGLQREGYANFNSYQHESMARNSYLLADAMMEARNGNS